MYRVVDDWGGGAATQAAGGRELAGGMTAGGECRGCEHMGAEGQLGQLLEGGSWQGNVEAGSRLGRLNCFRSYWEAGAGREGGSRRGI